MAAERLRREIRELSDVGSFREIIQSRLATLPDKELTDTLVALRKAGLRFPAPDQENAYNIFVDAAASSQGDRNAAWCLQAVEFAAMIRPTKDRRADCIRIRVAARQGGAESLASVINRLHRGIDADGNVPRYAEIVDAHADLTRLVAANAARSRAVSGSSESDKEVLETAIKQVVTELALGYPGQMPQALCGQLEWFLPRLEDHQLLGRAALHLIEWPGGSLEDEAGVLHALCALAPYLSPSEREELYPEMGLRLMEEIRDTALFEPYLIALTRDKEGRRELATFTAEFAAAISAVEESPDEIIHAATRALWSAIWQIDNPDYRESALGDLLAAAQHDDRIWAPLAGEDRHLSDEQCADLFDAALLSGGEPGRHLAPIFFPAADVTTLAVVERLIAAAISGAEPDSGDAERVRALVDGPPQRRALVATLLNIGEAEGDEPAADTAGSA